MALWLKVARHLKVLSTVKPATKARVKAVAHVPATVMAVNAHHAVSALIAHPVTRSSHWMVLQLKMQHPMKPEPQWNGLHVPAILQRRSPCPQRPLPLRLLPRWHPQRHLQHHSFRRLKHLRRCL